MRGLKRRIGYLIRIAGACAATSSLAAVPGDCRLDTIQYSTVKIMGALNGHGVIVSLDGAPAILTNSHLVQHLDRVQVVSPAMKLRFSAQVIRDAHWPLEDAVFLRPEQRVFEKIANNRYARTVEFCDPAGEGCAEGFRVVSKVDPSVEGIVTTIADTKFVAVPSSRPNQVTSSQAVEDSIVSGTLAKVFELPIPARQGMSGSAYFRLGALDGIIAKVELGPGHHAYAIPLQEIAKLLARDHFHHPVGGEAIAQVDSRWDAAQPGRMVIDFMGHQMVSGPGTGLNVSAGGLTGDGGGHGVTGDGGGHGVTGDGGGHGVTGDGGGHGVTGDGGFGSREARYWSFPVMRTRVSQEVIWEQTSNPFGSVPRQSLIDGKRYAFLRERAADGEHRSYPMATIPRFVQYLAKARSGFELIEKSAVAASELAGERKKNEREAQAWRVYSRRVNGDSVDFRKKSETTSGPALALLQASVPADLSELDLALPGLQATLKLMNGADEPMLLYQGKGVRAALLYNESDLRQLERILIETPDQMQEIVYCRIGTECVR